MHLLSIALAAFIVQLGTTEDAEKVACDGTIFNHVYYDKKAIVSNLGRPYNLVMHKFSGILFFSHTIQSVTQVDFGIMACHTEKAHCIEVNGISGGYAVAYDGFNDDIYFGGHNGIYKYNFMTMSADYFAEKGKSVWGIFIKKKFYYIQYPSQKLYVMHDDSFVQVAEAINIEIDNFFINKLEDVYFSNKTALFKVPKNSRQSLVLNDELIIRQIVEDAYGDVYFCGGDGIYIEDKPYHRVKKIADIDQAFGMAFDEQDHVIYSDKEAIYKLYPSKHSIECYNAIKGAQNNE